MRSELSKIALILGISVGVSSALAAPKNGGVTEIVLRDSSGYFTRTAKRNTIVLRSDGNAYRFYGTHEKLQRIHFSVAKSDFKRLVVALEDNEFWTLKPSYKTLIISSTIMRSTHGPSSFLEAVQSGKRKSVENYNQYGPQKLWEMETLVRGIAMPLIEKAQIRADLKLTNSPNKR